MSLDPALKTRIDELLKSHHVVLFMKGTRTQPMCGFSASATGILNEMLPEYHTVNVLEDQDLREGIKLYAEWPTIPQLYIDAELVGGADIIRQMYASGELHRLFGVPEPDRTPPVFTVTDLAAEAIRGGMSDAGDAVLHLEISTDLSASFQISPADANDIVSTINGVEVHLDPGSAQRAQGITIDWVETVQGSGLSLSFPGSQPTH